MSNEKSANRKLIAGRSIRWDEARVTRAYAEGQWVRETLVDALQQAARATPDRTLLVDGDTRVSCAQLNTQAAQLALAMLRRAPSGSVVSFLLPNWHEAAVIYMAATMAGMVANPILPSLRDHDLQFILKDVDSRFVFIPSQFRQHDYVAMLSRVTAQLETPPQVIVLRGDAGPHVSYASMFDHDASGPLPNVDPDAVRMVLYTSGTTGRPKGVLHTHNSLHALLQQIRQHWLVEPGDKFLVPSPISHIGGSIYAFESPLLLGSAAVLMERWDADEAVRIISAEHCTHMAGATPFLQQLLAACERAGTRLPSLKVFICGGASVPPTLIRKARDYFEKAVVTRVYGSTEVPVTTVGATHANEAMPAAETDGRRGFAEIKLVSHGSAQADEGEVHARGPQMLVGYLHQEDEASSFDAEGFFRTGDLARMQDDQYLVINGRAKDIIIRNGENISPKEIEDILVSHPQIAEIAIVGVPDSKTGERACAVIVAKASGAPDVDSLRNYLKELGVASFKIPEQVVIWDSLPKNDAGKVLKHQIRATLAKTV